jgi:hypothetical protein
LRFTSLATIVDFATHAAAQLPAVAVCMSIAGSVHVDVAGQSDATKLAVCMWWLVACDGMSGTDVHMCVVVAHEVLITYPRALFCAMRFNKER